MENKRKSVDNNTRRIKPRTKESQSQQEPENNAEGHGLDDAIISDDEEGGVRIGDIYIPPPTEPYCSTECKGPRLIIDCIKNYNFKSYAGEVVLGPFHHCFTSIIGPNGSGKSNVIDSMLFVFGYRAQKIRCKKLSVLLHNSALVPNSNRCSVAVCFKQIIDNEDGTYVDVPNSQIIIERVAFRDNTSYYTINGRRAHFREVAKLLKEHSIDLDHNRFLILQGEVESIAMMKPKAQNPNETGMLEYLEDIIGTTRYKEPLIKINSRVDELTEERAEKHNRCKLAEREMKDLEQPYNEAIDYLKLENTLTRTTNLHIQKYLSEQNKKLEEYSVEHDEIAAQLKKHDEEVNCLKEQRKEKEEFLQKEIAQNEKLHRTVETLKTKKEKAKNDGTEIQTRMTVTNKRRKQNKTQLEKLEAELIDLKNLPEKNQAQIGENEKKVVALTKEKAELEEQLQNNYANLEKETKPLIEKREVHTAKLEGLKKDVNEAKAELAVSEHELKILQHDEIVEKRKYESLKTAWEESEVDLNDKQEKFTELETRLPQFVQSIEKKQTELKKNIQEQEVLRGQLLTLRAEITEKQNSFQASRSNNKVLDFLMRQKNNGTIPGILGRLGDLGGIDARYDVAISTACGRLDNIVVDTVNTAQACIEHLRQYNVGRASFIALEKVSHLRNDMRRINTPENAPRLFDLVRVDDDRVLPAFYFALRNTLVADDLEQGTRLAYGPRRYRVVTLGGDVIEISGTMSGGGNTKIRGKMGQNVTTKTRQSLNTSVFTQEMLDKMEQKAVDMQSRVNFLQEEEGRLERELHQITTEKTRSESAFNRLKVAINSLQEQLPRVKIQLQEQKIRMEKTRSDSAKVAELQEIIQDKKETLKLSEDMADKVSTKINEIKKKIDAIHGDKIKTLQNKIEKISKQINTLNGSISKLNVEITSCARNRQKMENKIQNLKTDIDQSEDEIRALDKDRDKLTELIKSIENQIKEATAEINAASSGSSGIKQEIDEIQKKEIEYNLNRVEIEQKLQTIDKKIADVKSQLPHWRNKLRPLKLHTIPSETEPLEPLKTYTEEELATHKLQDIQYLVTVQEQDRDSRKPNLSCIQEYFTKREVYLERVKVLEDITTKRNEMRQLFDDIRKRRYNEFMHGFNIITRKLKEMYQMITQGGDAELELVDSMDPFTEGVSFSVRPPKKTWKNISNLSGGEKTLSSLALVFALHYYKPSPLYFLDEIDAALDFKNISIVAHYIKERTKNAQFIIISLRSNMFELSDYIVGIYKILDCTDSVTIKNFSILDALEIMRQVALPQLKRVMAQPIRRCSPPNTSQTIFNSTGSTVDGIGMGDTVFKRPLPPIKRSLTRMLDIASATAKIQ